MPTPQPEVLAVERTTQTLHQGPLPSPEVLAEYERLHPGTAATIIQMAQSQSEHRKAMERQAQQADIDHRQALTEIQRSNAKSVFRSDALGQVLGFLIAGSCVGLASYAIYTGAGWPVVAVCLGLPVAAIIKAVRIPRTTKPPPDESAPS